MIFLNLYVIIDYFIIPLNDLASAIALLAFWKGFRYSSFSFLEGLPLNILARYFLPWCLLLTVIIA